MILSKTDVNTYLSHSTSSNMIKFYQENTGKAPFLSLPICPKCERLGLRDKGWALHKTMVCPYCGYRGHATHQLSAFLKEGLYK